MLSVDRRIAQVRPFMPDEVPADLRVRNICDPAKCETLLAATADAAWDPAFEKTPRTYRYHAGQRRTG